MDGLRGLAILLVLLYHYISNSDRGPLGGVIYRAGAIFRLGWSGVDLFFVLSGFLIGGILLQARGSPRYFRTFYLRRFFRIVPIYYVWIVAYAFVALLAARMMPAPLFVSSENLKQLPLFFLFLQNFLELHRPDFGWYWLAALWSLAVEEQFYLIAPAVIQFLSPRRLLQVLLVTVAAAPLLRVCLYQTGRVAAMYGWMPCRVDALAIGVLAAIV